MLHQQSDQRTDNFGQTFHQQQILAEILQQLTESLKLKKKNSALDITRDILTDERPGCKVALKRTRTVEISDWVMGWEAAKNFGQIEHYLIDAGIDEAS